jgi:hypothetical protein
LEVCIEEHKYNLMLGVLKRKSKYTQYATKKRRIYRLNLTPPTGNARNQPICLWKLIRYPPPSELL